MININDYIKSTDSESFENAIKNKDRDGIILVPPRVSELEPERDYWLIDRAILLQENTTVIMQNSTIKLSDKCRDNFFRTANCGMGIEFPEKIKNVHIWGIGNARLVGADHPRATGDGSKILADPCPYNVDDLCRAAPWIPEERRAPEKITFDDMHSHSFGTDAGSDESQYGDWRGVGILFANAELFSVKNISITEPHGWSISLEECSNGSVEKIRLNACMSKMIDGMKSNMENQDGIDIRNGCHDILISDISGETGDDVIALTAIASKEYHPGGSTRNTHVMHNDWTKREKDIYNITVRNVTAFSHLCFTVRLLPVAACIKNIIIDGVTDNTPSGKTHAGTILLGDGGAYGENLPESMSGIILSNIICDSERGIIIGGYLKNSVISNVINKRKNAPLIDVERKDGMINVETYGLIQV